MGAYEPRPRDRGRHVPRPDHRPEPAGPVRPAGLAGVPGADRRGVRRHRGLPEGQGRPGLRGARRRHPAEVPPVRPGRQRARLRLRVRLLVPRHGAAGAAGPSGRGPLRRRSRRATRRTSSGRSPGSCAGGTGPGSCSITTTSARSCTSRASRRGASLPRRGLLALERATFRTADHVVSTNSSYAEIAMRRGDKGRDRRDRRAHRARRGPAAPPAARPDAAPRSAAPGRLHRRDGPAGRRRPGHPGGRVRRARARSRRRLVHLHGRRRLLRRSSWRCATSSG